MSVQVETASLKTSLSHGTMHPGTICALGHAWQAQVQPVKCQGPETASLAGRVLYLGRKRSKDTEQIQNGEKSHAAVVTALGREGSQTSQAGFLCLLAPSQKSLPPPPSHFHSLVSFLAGRVTITQHSRTRALEPVNVILGKSESLQMCLQVSR